MRVYTFELESDGIKTSFIFHIASFNQMFIRKIFNQNGPAHGVGVQERHKSVMLRFSL